MKSPVVVLFDASGNPLAVGDGGQQSGGAPSSALLIAGSDGSLARILKLGTDGGLSLGTGVNSIGKLGSNAGVTIGAVEIAAAQTLAAVTTVSTVTSVSAVTRLNQWNGNTISTNTGVRDAGTLRVTIATDDTLPVTFSAGPTTVAKTEDTASANADVGIPAMAIQKATPANTAGTDGDYEFLQMSAGRLWCSAVVTAVSGTVTVTGTVNTDLGTSYVNNDGSPSIGKLMLVGGTDGTNDQTIALDTTGAVKLAAGTNAIGKLATNSGVTIGAVEIAAAQTLAAVTTVSTVTSVSALTRLNQWNGNTISTNTGVRDAGTLRVSVATDDLVPVTFAASASSIGKAEDVASANADVGVPAMAVRKATPANTSGTDGDYEFLQMSAGRLWTSTEVTAVGGTVTVTGLVSTDIGTSFTNSDGLASIGRMVVVGGTDGTNDQVLAVDTSGAVKLAAGTNAIGKLATNSGVTIGAVELAAAQTLATVTTVSTVTSVSALTRLNQWGANTISTNTGVRDAGTLRVSVATDDLVPVTLPAGATSVGKAEDVASANADVGIPAMAVRKATPANTSGTDGDYEFLQMSAGRLWTSTVVTGTVTVSGSVSISGSVTTDIGTSYTNNDGSPNINRMVLVGGTDGTNDQTIALDTSGAVKLAAGSNSIGVLGSNAGVTIGAVELAAAQTLATVTTVSTVTSVSAVTRLNQWNGNTISTNTGVRDAGTLRVSVATDDLVPVTFAASASSIGKAEDSASANADVGVPAMAVQKATPANSSGTDGDYEFLQMSAGRLWTSTVVTGTVTVSGSVSVSGTVATDLGTSYTNNDGSPNINRMVLVGGTDGTNDQTIALDTSGAVKLAAGTNAIGKLATNSGVTIGAVEIAAAQTLATVTAVGTVTTVSTVSTVTSVSAVTRLNQWGASTISTNTGVRDAGTLRVSVATDDLVPVTFAASASSIAKEEDSASANADVGVPAMAVRKATPANTSGTDGDYEFLQMSAGRLWTSTVVTGTVTVGGLVSISGSVTTDIGTSYVNNDGSTSIGKLVLVGGTDGTNDQTIALDTSGAVKLAAGTNAIGKLSTNSGVTIGAVELAAAQTLATVTTVSTVTSVSALTRLNQWNGNTISTNTGVRDAGTLRVSVATDDLVPVTFSASATSIAKEEDSASANADVGVPSMAVRKATPANTSGSDGDYEFLQMSAGRLWTSTTVTGTVITDIASTYGNSEGSSAVGRLLLVGGTDLTDDHTFLTGTDGTLLTRPTPTQVRIQVTPTINTSAYANGDVLGGLMTISNAARVSGGSGTLLSVTVLSKTGSQRAAMDLLFFDQSVTVAANNSPVATSDGDMANCIGVVTIGAYNTAFPATVLNSISTLLNIGLPFVCSGTANLYCVAVARATATYTSTSDLIFSFTILQD